MTNHTFIPTGVCATKIILETDGEIIIKLKFEDGCHGNLQGLARLAIGRKISEISEILSGVKCGDKNTSCPDQLARALKTIGSEAKK